MNKSEIEDILMEHLPQMLSKIQLEEAMKTQLPIPDLNGFIQAWFLKHCNDQAYRCQHISKNGLYWLFEHQQFLTAPTKKLISESLSSCHKQHASCSCAPNCQCLITWKWELKGSKL